MSVRDNMAFPLRAAKAPESEVTERVNEAARMLQLEPYLTRRPNKLSGGEQQRVALGRAMVRHPKAFLMDEPLTNLDAELRAEMRAELKHAQERLNTTMIYVTHDQTEAMALGHRIAILNTRQLEQVGTPMEVYDRPATLFCARFIGSPPMNLIDVSVDDGALAGPHGLRIPAPDGVERGARLVAGLRPESLEVTEPGAENTVDARVLSEEALGDEVILLVDLDGADLRVRMPPTARFGMDAPVGVRHSGGPPPVYDPESEALVA
jgi:sn-glycerol 3-phosphate transport system ATP-binding protein/multiple sugar transport system ATP-binding protein